MYTRGPVIVMELPEQLNHVEAKRFLDELQPLLEVDRPSVVLDCSQIKHMGSAGVEMLLHCLEQAMKRDGDLKLAAISPASAVILELMRVDRLFEVFETSEEAVRSFQIFAPATVAQTQPWYAAPYGLTDLKAAG
jgi:anti-sigma B factor antagonist